jgi:HAD superfamily hydrolase (TIGR01662 family)
MHVVMAIRAVFFDVGETLVNESRLWHLWADWLGVPRAAFRDALDGVIARGAHHRRVFDVVRPDLAPFDVAAARRARVAAGWPDDAFTTADLYPDALPCLRALHALGYVVGIAGNQPVEAEAMLRALDVHVDVVASSARWGVEKPSPAFYERLMAELGLPAAEIAYVGDRLDNDVLPAVRLGLAAVLIRRGPWGYLHAELPEAAEASRVVDGLTGLAEVLRGLG